jgi:hypothetical protein
MKGQTKRAERRHHIERLKQSRRFYWGCTRDLSKFPKQLAKVVHTPTPCSCWACGNARKWFGEQTIQEQRLKQVLE